MKRTPPIRSIFYTGLIEFFKPSIYLSVDEIVDTIMTGLQQFTPHPIRDDVYLILASLK